MSDNPVFDVPVDTRVDLQRQGSWPASVHLFDQASADALLAAYYARRPLLVRGEPGTGKSQLARAVAQVFKPHRAFLSTVIHARSEAQDLQWEFDAVGRLGEAQTLGAAGGEAVDVRKRLDSRRYLLPGPLWWAFDWAGAAEHCRAFEVATSTPATPPGWQPEHGTVLLIDEIDKAEADLPNGLLEALGNGAFQVPYLDHEIGLADGVPPPLVIVTTNEDRELPAAFLRRCLVLKLALPEKDQDLIDCLLRRGGEHFGAQCDVEIRREAAHLLLTQRRKPERPRPGQAEYLDMLRALALAHPKDPKAQRSMLERIHPFALDKAAPGN